MDLKRTAKFLPVASSDRNSSLTKVTVGGLVFQVEWEQSPRINADPFNKL